MKLLTKLQRLITRTYDLDEQPNVADFVITCPRLAKSLGLSGRACESPEQVLVADRLHFRQRPGNNDFHWGNDPILAFAARSTWINAGLGSI